jgi:hypothetical protein
LVGLGTVALSFQPIQSSRLGDHIGGIELSNVLAGTGAPNPPGSIVILRGFAQARVDDPFSLPSGGSIGSVPVGTTISVSWSIDQAARELSASATGGVPRTVTFPPTPTTPFERLNIYFWMQRPTAGTALFIDDLYAEEF